MMSETTPTHSSTSFFPLLQTVQVLVRDVPFLAIVVPSLPRNAAVELEVRARVVLGGFPFVLHYNLRRMTHFVSRSCDLFPFVYFLRGLLP